MKKSRNVRIWMLVCILAACSAERHERTLWYVATDGDDANVCTESTDPCRTLAEVLGRADEDDKIILAAGIYNEVLPAAEDGSEFRFTGSLWITGAGIGETILDLTGSTGMQIFSGVTTLDNFTIQNALTNCILVSSTATIEMVEATRCARSGFRTTGPNSLTLLNVIASSNRNGADVNSGELIIEGGQFTGNASIGIESSGDSSLSVDGATIENNEVMGIYIVGGTANLSGLRVTGNSRLEGPIDTAVRISGGTVSITDSLIDGNAEVGLGMSNEGSLLVEDSTISSNAYGGLVIFRGGARVELANVIISNNCNFYAGASQPCAVINYGGTVAIHNSRITQNLSGAVWNDREGELSITETTIDQNIGGFCTILNDGNAVITNSLIANNTQYSGRPTLPSVCTIGGDLSVQNSTISNNGIGIDVRGGELALSFVTIAENDEVGLQAGSGPDLVRRLDNVLIVKNGILDCIAANNISAFSIGGTNFDSDSTCPESFFTRSPAEILLDSLADNGGLTLTHSLLPGSPAIDAASSSCPENDQRLIARPVGAACDVGAYEAGASTTSLEATPTPSEIIALVLEDARCRTGPGQIYPDFDFFEPGQTTQVKGRSADSNWYQVEALSYTGNCWIGKGVLEFNVSAEVLLALPIINPPPTPTATLDPDESYDITPTVCPTLINNPGSCQ